MSNATQEPGRGSADTSTLADHVRQIPGACQLFPLWCEDARPDHQEHYGQPDVPPVSATGERAHFKFRGGAAEAPTVVVFISANHIDHPGQVPVVGLDISRPDAPHDAGQWSHVYLTPDEADLLRRHLVQALRDLGRDVEEG